MSSSCLGRAFAAALSLVMVNSAAAAEDALKIAVGQRGLGAMCL